MVILASACERDQADELLPEEADSGVTDPRQALLGTYQGTVTGSSYTAGQGFSTSSHDTTLVVTIDTLAQSVSIGSYFQHILVDADLQLSLSPPFSGGNGTLNGYFQVVGDSTKLHISRSSTGPISSWTTSFTGYKQN